MSALTLDMIREAHARIRQIGVPLEAVKFVLLPTRFVVARRHSKRRNGGKRSYHRRVQKKWAKRWGFVDGTALRSGQAFGFKGGAILVREDDYHRLERFARITS